LTVSPIQPLFSSGPATAPAADPAVNRSTPDGVDLLAMLGQASLAWHIAGDTLQWSDNVAEVLTGIPLSALSKASEFSKLIEPSRGIRNDAVLNSTGIDTGSGVPYQIEYGVRTGVSAPMLWIDECGRWFAGPDSRPS